MKRLYSILQLAIAIFTFTWLATAQAGKPVWTFTPVQGYPPSVFMNSTQSKIIKYTVANQSQTAHLLRMKPINGITSSGCEEILRYGKPCTLSLSVSGQALKSNIIGGPVLCDHNNPNQCYQPSKNNEIYITLTQAPPPLSIQSTLPNGVVNTPYSASIQASGGTKPYSCALTAGTLPAGLSLSNCTITGMPTIAETVTLTINVTDSSNPAETATSPISLTVVPAPVVLTLTSPPSATVSAPYSGTIGVSGGTAPYTCILISGTLPPGLSLSANCIITGTPTTAGIVSLTIKATDSSIPAATTTGPITLTTSPVSPLTFTGSLPNAIDGAAYVQTLTATGGIPPYSYSMTAGQLSAGITLSTDGTVSGTPTAVGASSFTVTVTDSAIIQQTASLPLVLLVTYPTTPNDAALRGPYAYLFQGYDGELAGVLAYQTATIGSFTANGSGVINTGELDSNHQSSNPLGNTISSQQFLGTYTLDADNRGLMTLTTLNADGTTDTTSTYAITVKAPVTLGDATTQASMIQFDNDGLVGTRGSGTILAQTPANFSTGLNGSFAFGFSGDTPCLPTCTNGITAGPVGSVGQFTANGGLLTSGTSDANIATTNYSNAPLSGSYGIADANGRLSLTMDTAGTPNGVYPTNYAVYLVDQTQAFIMSTDKHSAYVLLAGTAQVQTQAPFSNASMSGPIIGYENTQVNPGMLGVTLQNVLNLSIATIFRTVGNGTGTCDFTNVDIGGLTSLINELTGLGGDSATLNALMGLYQSIGNSACTVAANGRGILDYPPPSTALALTLALLGLPADPPAPRVFYLSGPRTGYFLETGYAGVGNFASQAGAPFTTASLSGTYVYASQPAAALNTANIVGIFTATGSGSATTLTDTNAGNGNINILQPDVTQTFPYSLSNATEGRFIANTTTVLYAISPAMFVLFDTNLLNSSPGVALLYK